MDVRHSEASTLRSTLTLPAAPNWSSALHNAHSNLGVHLTVHDQDHQAIFDSPDRYHFGFRWNPSRSVFPARQLLGHTYRSTTSLRGFAVVYQSRTRQDLVDVGLHVDTTDIIGCK